MEKQNKVKVAYVISFDSDIEQYRFEEYIKYVVDMNKTTVKVLKDDKELWENDNEYRQLKIKYNALKRAKDDYLDRKLNKK